MIVAPSPDLVYLTGYEPMPMERPTLLVLRAGSRARAWWCPNSNDRSLAAPSARAVVELVGWRDGDDPYTDRGRPARTTPGRVAIGDRTVGVARRSRCKRVLPDLDFEPASPVIGRLRAVKDADELAALRRAARGADETFRQICSMTFQGRREEEVAADLADLLVQQRSRPRGFHDRGERAERRLAAP